MTRVTARMHLWALNPDWDGIRADEIAQIGHIQAGPPDGGIGLGNDGMAEANRTIEFECWPKPASKGYVAESGMVLHPIQWHGRA